MTNSSNEDENRSAQETKLRITEPPPIQKPGDDATRLRGRTAGGWGRTIEVDSGYSTRGLFAATQKGRAGNHLRSVDA